MSASLKLMTPAKTRAVYSPRDSPAVQLAVDTVFASVCLNSSTAAIDDTKRAGCAYTVLSSLLLGPARVVG